MQIHVMKSEGGLPFTVGTRMTAPVEGVGNWGLVGLEPGPDSFLALPFKCPPGEGSYRREGYGLPACPSGFAVPLEGPALAYPSEHRI